MVHPHLHIDAPHLHATLPVVGGGERQNKKICKCDSDDAIDIEFDDRGVGAKIAKINGSAGLFISPADVVINQRFFLFFRWGALIRQRRCLSAFYWPIMRPMTESIGRCVPWRRRVTTSVDGRRFAHLVRK